MEEYKGAFVAFDVAKSKHSVAIAESGRRGEVRFLGEIENTPAAVERITKKLAGRYERLQVCFEAGPTGYGLCWQIQELGHNCMVVAPALIPNRRDAVTLAAFGFRTPRMKLFAISSERARPRPRIFGASVSAFDLETTQNKKHLKSKLYLSRPSRSKPACLQKIIVAERHNSGAAADVNALV